MQKPKNDIGRMALLVLVVLGGIGALVAINRASEQAAKTTTVEAVGHDHDGDGKPDANDTH
ncbi:MAG: hypothetical protein H8F28_10595 [Fibrella sp.]|nr:hypothetical protein [Armatimonadota bacterium]